MVADIDHHERHVTEGVSGLSNGGGGVDRAPKLDPTPQKGAQVGGPPKTNLGTYVVQMVVVFVLGDTWYPVNFGYTCV